jgi:hypothetical protein
MADFSFEIKNSKDFFAKLLTEYEEFRQDTTVSRTALNCSMTAWHLIEWVYHEFDYKTSGQFNKLFQFQEHLKIQCPSLQIMQELTNGTKHCLLTRNNSVVKDTKLHQGPYSREYSREYDVSTLEIELNDGTKKYFEDEIELAVTFWKSYMQANHGVTI